ncbi:molybdopterin-binding protein [Desulfosporosinus sp. PR]|uniref:molybdopterin-binding protein n=1 Tax=Candidatus Desulfosporosinus nitrosoreducens TaxID=3401928 RepID=UPI00280048CC|nr:molybdopterin-binding protein [Desulfosporosinus sp. PR]MDQ7095427.1 molybdopterin-binding protein [Desulfosporosinus sp. PR]
MKLDLLEKTELFINNIELEHVHLGSVAKCVAEVLRLECNEVNVVDVREGILTLDILRPYVELEQIIGKEGAILEALRQLPGIRINQTTFIHSEGILGMVCFEMNESEKLVSRVEKIGKQIALSVSKRVKVFPTGTEIIKNYIEDTNTPFLVKKFNEAGYKATAGPVLEDDLILVSGALKEAVDNGFGLVITTGGVGAEDKDHTVEAILKLDQEAATPYLVHYHQGQGRHRKDGVRIAVGQLDWTTFVALPGPHDEVEIALPVLLEGLKKEWDKNQLANVLADVLRRKWELVSHDWKHVAHSEN